MAFSVFDKAIDLDVLYHPILNAIYYTVRNVGTPSSKYSLL
jgi:hypothetical protein